MLNIELAIARILSFATEHNLSAREFGNLAGVPESTADDLLRRRGNPTEKTIIKMESVAANPSRFESEIQRIRSESKERRVAARKARRHLVSSGNSSPDRLPEKPLETTEERP